jgi:AGZA family xanthine/uracil permease-like MFS transporter
MVTLGDLHKPDTLLAIFGLAVTAALLCRRVNAAILIGVIATWMLAAAVGMVQRNPQPFAIGDIAATAGQLNITGALGIGILEIIFVFLFVDLFDNIGTLLAVGKKAGLFTDTNDVPRLNRILFSDAAATIAGAAAGTSTVVSYIESSAGVAAGGRSGVTAIVAGLLFVLALFVAPFAGPVPLSATAPALIVVGSMMMSTVREIEWDKHDVAIPAFLTMLAIPLTFSIANGIAFGFCAWTLLKLFTGRLREVSPMVYLLTALFIARFFYLRGV